MSYVMRTMKIIPCNNIFKSQNVYLLDLDHRAPTYYVFYIIYHVTCSLRWLISAVTEDTVLASGKRIKTRCKSLLLHFDCVTNNTWHKRHMPYIWHMTHDRPHCSSHIMNCVSLGSIINLENSTILYKSYECSYPSGRYYVDIKVLFSPLLSL